MKSIVKTAVLALFLALQIACGQNSEPATENFVESTTMSISESVQTTSPTLTPSPTPTATPLPESIVPSEFLATDSGIPPSDGFFLKQNENLYWLSSSHPVSTSIYPQDLYLEEYNRATGPRYYLISYIASENVPTYTGITGDSIIGQFSSAVPTLKLYRADLAGYTVRVRNIYNGTACDTQLYPEDGNMQSVRSDKYPVSFADPSGNDVESKYYLAQGEQYTVYWYEGTQYHKVIMPANYPCYEIYVDTEYEIAGELTKDGYAKYNVSDMPKGTYMTSSYGIINIQ